LKRWRSGQLKQAARCPAGPCEWHSTTVVKGRRPETGGETAPDKAREVKGEGTEMMNTYLQGEDDPLDGFEFLTMAEAGEVGHLMIVQELNKRAGIPEVTELVGWALPIQERHLKDTLQGSLELAAEEDPNGTA
jgi:hypothetical protein